MVTPTLRTDGVIIISMKALQSEKVRKLWTLIAASAVGKYLNDNPKLALTEILFADVTDMKARPVRYLALPTGVAKSVQSRVYNGDLTLDDAQEIIQEKLVRRTQEIK
jgi:hypothetical protein